MPVHRLAALARSIADFRVEALFVAALAFTLASRGDAPMSIVRDHLVTTRATVIHGAGHAPVIAPDAPAHGVHRKHQVVRAVSAPGYRFASASGGSHMVVTSDSGTYRYCAVFPASATPSPDVARCTNRVAPRPAVRVVVNRADKRS